MVRPCGPKIVPPISTDEQVVYDAEEGYVTTSGRKVTAQQYYDWRNRKFDAELNNGPKKTVVPKPNFKMRKLDSYFKGEDIPNNKDNWLGGTSTVKYLNDSERAKLKVNIGKDGKLYDSEGKLFDTSEARNFKGEPKAIFTMDEQGNLFVSKHQERGVFHHSSISAGKPVAMAGEIDVKDGVLKHFSNRSGHYRPTTQHLNQGIDHHKAQELNFESAKIIDEY